MDQWIKEGLSRVLEFEVPEDMISYIMSIEREADLSEYLKTLLDFDNAQHRSFFMELMKKKFPGQGVSAPRQKKKISKNKTQLDFISMEPIKPAPEPAAVEKEGKSKKKTKFVNLYSQEGENAQVVLLKGRHRCDCEASKHELINNCLNCGRIVCKQEGSGPCLYCGNLVCTPEEEQEISSNTKGGAKLKDALSRKERPKGWEEALAHMHKLLDYERNSEKRTHVVDDDCDYFNTSSVWLSQEEKDKLQRYQQQLHDKKHASRLAKKMTFDFVGRQIIEDAPEDTGVDLNVIKEITGGGGAGPEVRNPLLLAAAGAGRDVAPGVDTSILNFNPVISDNYATVAKCSSSAVSKVQDPQLLEMSDTGRCLSMHQPWASLLVDGIKLHEGRTWYTSHRGRLWIASTVKPPDQDVIRSLENQYRVLYPDKNIVFPTFYPTGCLLGCVNVDDCLPQEEYQKLYPGGESDSPYVFICSNPTSLKLRFPVKGQHKIYQLDKTIHKAAVKSLQNMAKIQAEQVKAG